MLSEKHENQDVIIKSFVRNDVSKFGTNEEKALKEQKDHQSSPNISFTWELESLVQQDPVQGPLWLIQRTGLTQ